MSTDSVKTEVGSYFVSNYPPYSQWSAEEIPLIERALAQPPAHVPLGLYLHIPFCRKRCKFCYFKVFTEKNAAEVERYVSALCREIELVSRQAVMGGRPIRFVYFGGGTPSYLSARQLTSLVDRLRANVNWDLAEEVTFECEPGTLQRPKLETIRSLGVTRLSLGVENFNDAILEGNGRAHLSREVFRAWDWITDVGFPNVNIDLIAGMVGETGDNWRENIRRTIELNPDSVTIYQMELPFNTVISRQMLDRHTASPVADWPTKRAWVDEAFDQLLDAGYHVSSGYTVVKNPDRVNFSYRDNLWQGADLLATGIASFGHLSGVHYQNKPEWNQYLGDLLEEGVLPIGRAMRISDDQRLIREMILQLKRGWLERGYFVAKFGVDIVARWRDEWDDYRAAGWVDWDDDRIELTRAGLLRVDGLLPAFFEPPFRQVRST